MQRGEEIVGDAMGKLAENIGSGRGDKEQVNALRDSDVLNRALDIGGRRAGGAERFGDDFLAGEGGEGEGRDEFLRGARHHDLDVDFFLLEGADKLGGFVSCDAPGDPKRDSHGSRR